MTTLSSIDSDARRAGATPGPTARVRAALLAVSMVCSAAGLCAQVCQPPLGLAERVLFGSAGWGDLAVESSYSLDESLLVDSGRLVAMIEAVLAPEAVTALRGLGARTACAALVLEVDGELLVHHDRTVQVGDLAGASGWRYGVRTELPEGTSQVLILVQSPEAVLWGVALAEDTGELVAPPGPEAIRAAGSGDEMAWHEVLHPAAPIENRAAEVVVRLVPPRREPVAGTVRFDALVSTEAVEEIVFELDGREVARRKRGPLSVRPFSARIELDDPPRRQTLEAVALDRGGRELGRDVLDLNRLDVPFRVRIRELRGDPRSGSMEIAAQVSVPAEKRLERVELYRNETLVARFEGSFETRVETPDAGPDDYLRVAAYLIDGSTIDDVVLLTAPGTVEEVEVNLVELHAVVTDGSGRPVDDLSAEDFAIIHRGEAQAPQSFAYADDVPLLLGVVIDTSGSMQLVMHDTRRAAAKFLGTTVLPQDRSFLVDFDQKPRLLHPTTDDLPALLMDLSRLEADGSTAMYDAIVFSMLQFERVRGRKALVILTDGDDYESRFGPKYCAELGERAGVPIYIIGLGNLDIIRRTYRKSDLRKVTDGTGGRLYIVDSLEELDQAYAQINAELRSQYSLSFYTDRDLSDEERRQVRVELRRPGLEARTVIGAGSRGAP